MWTAESSSARSSIVAVLQHAKEVTGNVSLTSRYFGISRPAFYTWRNRFEEHAPRGCATARAHRTTARRRPARTWWARSSTRGEPLAALRITRNQ